jgi:deoxyribonuclease V
MLRRHADRLRVAARSAVTRARARRHPITFRDRSGRVLRTSAGNCQNTVLMPGTDSGILETWKPAGAWTAALRRCGRALPEHRRRAGSRRAGANAAFAHVLAERTALVPQVAPYRPGEFYLRELPPLRAVLAGLDGLGLLVVDGYADLDPGARPGLGARAHAEFGIPVIGVAKSRFRTATHAVPVVRGSSARPLFVTAAGMPAADEADLVRDMAGPPQPP